MSTAPAPTRPAVVARGVHQLAPSALARFASLL